jgi:YHS domain-containing protein
MCRSLHQRATSRRRAGIAVDAATVDTPSVSRPGAGREAGASAGDARSELGARGHILPYEPTEYPGDDDMAMTTDPVCGMQVDTDTAQHTAEHEGKTYYFCSRGCKLDFEDEPERYLDPAHKPSMEGH